jgi:ATP-dependent DNA helicase RecG
MSHKLVHVKLGQLRQLGLATLNDDQQRALEQIKRDLRAAGPMRRLLTGQAGSGKALVAVMAAILVAESRCQVVWLSPSALSAEIRARFVQRVLSEIGIKSTCILGDPSRKERTAIRRGDVQIIFGPPDLLSQQLEFRRLGMVISEELGVHGGGARALGFHRGLKPDLLVLNMVPVPAARYYTVYRDYDLTMVDRENADSWKARERIWDDTDRATAYSTASEVLAKGRQVLIVFPTSRGVDRLDLREATQLVSTLRESLFKGARVELMHGAATAEERVGVFEQFRRRMTDVLVATTLVEDGPDLHSVGVVIVEHADQMTVSRLLRLRGHFSTGVDLHYVLGSNPSEEAQARLEFLASGHDEYELADAFPELFDALESSVDAPDFTWHNPVRRDVVVAARTEAHQLLSWDPPLRRPTSSRLVEWAHTRWGGLFASDCPLPPPTPTSSGRRKRRRRKRK